MIFTTKNKELAIFGKTLTETKGKLIDFFEAFERGGIRGQDGIIDTFFSKDKKSPLTPELLSDFENFKNLFNSSQLSAEALAEQMENVDQRILDYAKTCKNGKMTTEGFKASINNMSLSANAGQVALQALAIAGNMIAMWAITKGLQLAIQGIDNLIHSTERCKERVDELMSSYQSALDKANSNAKTVEDLAAKYERLSKGVNNLGENVSLTTDEYTEYNKIVNQIADMFPTLVQGYTNEGNAILSLKGNVEQLRDAYKEAQQEAYNLLIIDGKDSDGNDIIKNWENVSERKNFSFLAHTSTLEAKNALQDLYDVANAGSVDSFKNLYDAYERYLTGDFSKVSNAIDRSNWINLTEDDLKSMLPTIHSYIQTYQAEIDSALKNVQTLANAYLMTNEDYAILDDQSKNAASIIVNSINDSIASGFANKEAVGAYVIGIVNSIKDNPEIQDALVGLFTLDTSDMQPNDAKALVDQYIDYIARVIGENPVELKVRLGFEDVDTIAQNYNRVVQQAATKFSGESYKPYSDNLLYSAELEALNKFAEENSINTQDEIAFWNKCIEESETREEAMEKYLESPVAAEDPISFSSVLSDESLSKFQSTIDSLKSSLTTLYNGDYSSTDLISSLSNINKALSDIGKADVLNWEEITNIDDLDNVIDQITTEYVDGMLESLKLDGTDFGDAIRNVIQEELKASRQLETYKSNVSDLKSAYSDLTDVIETYNANGYITFDQLTSLLEMEPQYLSCLIDDNGQLQLNQESMMALANQRLEDAEAQAVQQAITELGQLALQDEKTAVEENAAAFNSAVNDLAVYNGELANTIGEASVASSVIRDLNAAISGAESQGATDAQIGTVLDNLNTKLQLIKNTRLNLDKSIGNIMGGSSSASSSTSSAKSEFEETIDFFERRVKVLDDALSHLKSSLDNVTGSFAKNNLIDAELGITEEKFNNYTDALAMYTQKANEAFSKIPADIASTVKDGAVSLTEFIGDSNKDVVEAIKEYESWTDKITDCTQELEELKTAIRQLELEKFNNIMDDFSNQFDLRGDSKDLISKQIDLLKEAGELIGESFYTSQIDQSKKQLELLENEKAQLVNQLSSAINSGRIQAGTEEWLEMVNALSDVDGSILDCQKSIEEFDNSLLELHTEIFNRIQEQFSNLDSEISNIINLFDEFEVSDDKGIWSKEGITQLGLLAQQYELAQYQVQQYNNEIDELNKQYLAGRYSATEYADKLADLSSAQWDAVKSTESAKDSIMDLNETRIENQIKGIEKEIDAYKELADAQIDALKASKDLHDYENSIAEKTKSITDLERQIAAIQNDTSAATVAKKKKLEEQLAEAKKDLEETEYDHSIEIQEDALNKQYENYEKERNGEIDALRESLNDKEAILAESFETVKENASVVGQEIATIATEHGITVSNALISSWQSGENAIASYREVLSQSTSAFIQNIMSVENEVWNLQAQANTTADSLAWMFSAKADNLVNELNMSYYAEATLADMTNALQQSLVNTLERGYDASSIVNSLNSITAAAEKAKRALSDLNNPTTPDAQNLLTNDVGKNVGKSLNDLKQQSQQYQLIDKTTGRIWKDNLSYAEALEYKKDHVTDINTSLVKKYASGTRNAGGGLRIINEAGPELVLPKLPSGNYTVGNAGDQILTKVETDNIFGWAKLNPDNLIPVNITDYMDNLKAMSIPQVLPSNVNNNNNPVQIENLINVQGSVNSSDLKQMESIANKAVDKLVNKIHDGIMYGT